MAAVRSPICAQACFFGEFSNPWRGKQFQEQDVRDAAVPIASLVDPTTNGRGLVAATLYVWKAPIPNIAGVV
jgi:hypothetical protein